MAGPDYILDIQGLDGNAPDNARNSPADEGGGDRGRVENKTNSGGTGKRRWLAVSWRCCGVYSRIYINRAGDAYEGSCPKCGKTVRAKIGPGGTAARFFQAH